MITAWPFLVSANPALDYQTVMVPDFLARTSAQSQIALAVYGKPSEANTAYLRQIPMLQLTLLFRIRLATGSDLREDSDEVVRDPWGRRISLIEGIVLRNPEDAAVVGGEAFERIRLETNDAFLQFWAAGDRWVPVPAPALEWEASTAVTKLEINELPPYSPPPSSSFPHPPPPAAERAPRPTRSVASRWAQRFHLHPAAADVEPVTAIEFQYTNYLRLALRRGKSRVEVWDLSTSTYVNGYAAQSSGASIQTLRFTRTLPQELLIGENHPDGSSRVVLMESGGNIRPLTAFDEHLAYIETSPQLSLVAAALESRLRFFPFPPLGWTDRCLQWLALLASDESPVREYPLPGICVCDFPQVASFFVAGTVTGQLLIFARPDGAPRVLPAHSSAVAALAVDHTGTLIASAASEEPIALHSSHSQRMIATAPTHGAAVTALRFVFPLSDHRTCYLVAADEEGTVFTYRVSRAGHDRRLELVDHQRFPKSAASPFQLSLSGQALAIPDRRGGVKVYWFVP